MPQLRSHLAMNDLPIFDRDDQILWISAKMPMDDFPIFGDGSNFHFLFSCFVI
jgi:hypothetical protein